MLWAVGGSPIRKRFKGKSPDLLSQYAKRKKPVENFSMGFLFGNGVPRRGNPIGFLFSSKVGLFLWLCNMNWNPIDFHPFVRADQNVLSAIDDPGLDQIPALGVDLDGYIWGANAELFAIN